MEVVLGWDLSERLDMVELWERADSLEPLRLLRLFIEGVRGGNAGDGASSEVLVRLGRGGGALRAGKAGLSSWMLELDVFVRCGRAGGSRFWGRAGRTGLGSSFSCEGFLADGGGGGGALLDAVAGGVVKFFCPLRAAMRSARELNCGSCTSAMVKEGKRGRGDCWRLTNVAKFLSWRIVIRNRE